MNSNKISFGIKAKRPNVLPFKPQQPKKDVELIECVEEQSIKVKNPKDEKSKGPLVIPFNEPSNAIVERIKESRAKRNVGKNEVDERPDSELTLDELAARELLREVKNAEAENTATKVLEVQKIEGTMEGKAEPTIDDYENVPISDYGLAMLRGMGWKEGMVLGKNQNAKIEVKEPALRPKGLGLGANKMGNAGKQTAKTEEEKELVLKKGAYAKITHGHHKSSYCQIEGFDDDGRVFVKLAIGGLTLSLHEFALTLVTKQEYEKSSKVINNARYEDYIKSETSSSGIRRTDEPDANRRIKKEVEEDRSSRRRSRSQSVDRRIKKEVDGDRSSRRSSRSKSVDRDHRKHKKSSKKHKKRSNSSSADDEEERKSRRSKKDRSRSRERSKKHKRKHKR